MSNKYIGNFQTINKEKEYRLLRNKVKKTYATMRLNQTKQSMIEHYLAVLELDCYCSKKR